MFSGFRRSYQIFCWVRTQDGWKTFKCHPKWLSTNNTIFMKILLSNYSCDMAETYPLIEFTNSLEVQIQ